MGEPVEDLARIQRQVSKLFASFEFLTERVRELNELCGQYMVKTNARITLEEKVSGARVRILELREKEKRGGLDEKERAQLDDLHRDLVDALGRRAELEPRLKGLAARAETLASTPVIPRKAKGALAQLPL